MNKAEIIRKISKKGGVPDTEAKKFFEIFLKNASEILKPGESLEIEGVGIFQLRVGQIENRSSQNPDKEFIYSDLIVYIDREGELSEDKEVIFNVPSGIEKEYEPVDAYFSVSIGKPVIPLKGVKETEFFIPPSGMELRSLFESKIARLINEAEKTEGGKETETIHLTNDGESTGEQIGWKKYGEGNAQDETVVPNRSDFLKTREFENLSWDFGENLFDEIEEESVPDTPMKQEKSTPEDKSSANAGAESEPAEVKPEFEEESSDDISEEDIFEEIIDEETEETVYFEDDSSEFQDSISEKDELKTEEEVTKQSEAGTGEYDNEIKPEQMEEKDVEEEEPARPEKEFSLDEPEDLTEPEPEPRSPEPEEPSLKNFQRVRSLTREFTTTEFNDTEETETEKPKRITEVRGGYQKVRRTTAEFNFDLSGIEGLDEIDDEPPVKKKKRGREYQGYRKRSTVPSLIIALVVVIALAGIIFLYFKLKSANNELSATGSDNSGQTTTIERNYDVPVTYPYNKSGEDKAPEKGTVEDQQGKSETELKTSANTAAAKPDLTEIREPVNARRIGNYIYQYPEGVVVQVSSWKSKSIALSEVQKYRDAGYTAFAEKSEIQGMGLYYRVRVGYFKSLDEAEKFVNGNH